MIRELNKPCFGFLPMSEIRPKGWLYNQLKIQAEGLSGNLDTFWPDIKDSKWIGGSTDGWERMPYWLDGFIPLAYLLDDEDMKERANKYVNAIIEKQEDDGWICPVEMDERNKYDIWALLLILKVLVVYHDATDDERVEVVVSKALQALDKHIDANTLANWGHTRWFEGLISIWWLYERRPENWLLNLVSKLNGQGFNWKEFFKHWTYQKPDDKGRWSQMSHVVNNAMAFKAGPLMWRYTGEEEDLELPDKMSKLLSKYHGMVTGLFSGDECLSGNSPVQGTELCAVAEYMYSLEHVLAITGKAYWGDLLERISYNALPATFSPDMWTHQYVQQVNQPQCSRQVDPVYYTNSGEAGLFGLEPNYGCCTANLSQPWPKLACSTIMRIENGLVASIYAPSVANTKINDTKVSFSIDTDYPFRETVIFTVTTDKPTEFDLYLRIPQWCSNPSIEIEGVKENINQKDYYKLTRTWEGEIRFTLTLPMEAKLVERPNNLYAITRGPLVYSLAVEENWMQINKDIEGHEYPHCDYEVFPTTAWNYGLVIDKENFDKKIKFLEKPIEKYPFSPEGAPIIAKIKGKKVEWSEKDGVPNVAPKMSWVAAEVEEIKFIPFGCTNLRMTEMPIVE